MANFAQFKKPAAAGAAASTPAATKGKAPRPYTPRHAGVSASEENDPMPQPGFFELEIVETSDSSYPGIIGREGYFKAKFTVVQAFELDQKTPHSAHSAGDPVTVIQQVTGKAEGIGKSKVKALLIAAAGFNTEAEFEEGIEDWAVLWDACSKIPQAEAIHGVNPLAGRRVLVQVTAGKPDGKGGFYGNYAWAPSESA